MKLLVGVDVCLCLLPSAEPRRTLPPERLVECRGEAAGGGDWTRGRWKGQGLSIHSDIWGVLEFVILDLAFFLHRGDFFN